MVIVLLGEGGSVFPRFEVWVVGGESPERGPHRQRKDLRACQTRSIASQYVSPTHSRLAGTAAGVVPGGRHLGPPPASWDVERLPQCQLFLDIQPLTQPG